MKILFYGYGNPGRQDDGLGIMFIEQIEQWIKDENLENIETDSNYQLNIEDAEIISHKDFVIFLMHLVFGINVLHVKNHYILQI